MRHSLTQIIAFDSGAGMQCHKQTEDRASQKAQVTRDDSAVAEAFPTGQARHKYSDKRGMWQERRGKGH